MNLPETMTPTGFLAIGVAIGAALGVALDTMAIQTSRQKEPSDSEPVDREP